MTKSLSASYFRTWVSGSKEHIANPDPPPEGTGKPFVVRLGNEHVIPLNVLVFATDIDHAKRRVVVALEECCEKDYRGKGGVDHRTWVSLGRQYDLLERLRSGEYELTARPFDTDTMPGIQWASNGGLT